MIAAVGAWQDAITIVPPIATVRWPRSFRTFVAETEFDDTSAGGRVMPPRVARATSRVSAKDFPA